MKIVISLFLVFSVSPAFGLPKRFKKVDDNLYHGRQPAPQDYAELKKMGINTILDLRGGSIHKPHERKEAEAAGLNYVSIRLSGIWEPHDAQMETILKLLSDTSKGPFFIHCHRGADRVNLVVACYRMTHDHWTNQQALQEARANGMNPVEVLMKRYIAHFNPNSVHLNAQAAATASAH